MDVQNIDIPPLNGPVCQRFTHSGADILFTTLAGMVTLIHQRFVKCRFA